MSIEYQRDDLQSRATVTVTGSLDLPEMRALLQEHRSSDAWTGGLLYDLRFMTDLPPKEAMREFAAAMRPRPGESPRGPVAIVVTDPLLYARACSYAVLVKPYALFEVFRNRDEADAWLSSLGH